DLKYHMDDLLVSIGRLQPSLRQRAVKRPASRNASSTDSFKMAKHRLTPRLEHLTDYGFLSPCSKERGADEAKEFCCQGSQTGRRGAAFLKGLTLMTIPKLEKSIYIPVLKTFFLHHAMEFFFHTESLKPTALKHASQSDLIENLFWA